MKKKSGMACNHKLFRIDCSLVQSERYTTGLFEDIELRMCLGVESVSSNIRTISREIISLGNRISRAKLMWKNPTIEDVKKNAGTALRVAKAVCHKIGNIQNYAKLIPYVLTLPAAVNILFLINRLLKQAL